MGDSDRSFLIKQDPKILALVKKYPRLFHRKPPKVWSDLPAGWVSIVDQMCTDLNDVLNDAEAKQFKIVQIKEKFGGLRVYWEYRRRGYHRPIDEPPPPNRHAGFERIFLIVHAAIQKASRTCQWCGATGALVIGNGWYITLCPAHEANPVEARQ